MDVNVNTDVKAYGIAVVPATEVEDQTRPQVPPVQENSGSESAALNDQKLHGREVVDQRSGQLSGEEVQKLVKDLQKRLDPLATSLNFTIDEETDTLVVKITDRETGELIRQVPPEEMLNLRASLAELVGVLFDKKA
jgi:flagellar protein FlaG